ncbi:DUF2254 domain-containing protein [Photobacterium atrarenae]|uniref:DUF2254 domain-containing protein n=1 Tax=Photobacterium atrarenae TaxID=865757 RepID=A0ABY5GMV1_9GAMM|nr:DUF2254 domain-containing protein [Photobacterium atrarenae]UTV30620.1 DUF2254 domain-containing protein [Photobacterium atrarenae]
MKIQLQNWWEGVRTSFWFVPGGLVLIAIGAAHSLIVFDQLIELALIRQFSFLYFGGPEGARVILSTLAGSMVTVAGVVFSITIVALTLASSQFGPRLLRNFMQDTGTQYVLGIFIATFIYCLFVLSAVNTEGPKDFVPYLSVNIALVLAVLNVGVLIYFIHHVSVSIQADQVVATVYDELVASIELFFPGPLQHEPDPLVMPDFVESTTAVRVITATCDGYLQALDDAALVKAAAQSGCFYDVRFRPGDFITRGETLVAVTPCDRTQASSPEPEASDVLEVEAQEIRQAFVCGALRTAEQDPEFALNQMVEIALRALSPGINDPFTAMTCLDRLGAVLSLLSCRQFPHPLRCHEEAQVCCRFRSVSYTGMVNAAFDQIRQCAASNVAVSIRLLEVLATMAKHGRTSEQQQAIGCQAEMVWRAGQKTVTEPEDLREMQSRYQQVTELLRWMTQ